MCAEFILVCRMIGTDLSHTRRSTSISSVFKTIMHFRTKSQWLESDQGFRRNSHHIKMGEIKCNSISAWLSSSSFSRWLVPVQVEIENEKWLPAGLVSLCQVELFTQFSEVSKEHSHSKKETLLGAEQQQNYVERVSAKLAFLHLSWTGAYYLGLQPLLVSRIHSQVGTCRH